MQRGRKLNNPAVNKLAGTFRPDRHATLTVLEAAEPSTAPVAPSHLSPFARQIWNEEVPRIVGCGAKDADTSMIARYCEMEAVWRATIATGDLPKTALITELRRTAELLGIAGPRSRLARTGSPEPVKASPFTVAPR